MIDFSTLKAFLLIIGNARSGSTLTGSIINAHINAIVANETQASRNFWEGLTKEEIYKIIELNVQEIEVSQYLYSGYKPISSPSIIEKANPLIIGEKIWNPATLLLHGKYNLIEQLSLTLGLPILLIHTIRNPFNTIATMHLKSGAPLHDRIAWYFMHCEAVDVISKRFCAKNFLHVYHENIILNPEQEIIKLCGFLNLPVLEHHLAVVRQSLFNKPNESRDLIAWSNNDILQISRKMENYEFLHNYL